MMRALIYVYIYTCIYNVLMNFFKTAYLKHDNSQMMVMMKKVDLFYLQGSVFLSVSSVFCLRKRELAARPTGWSTTTRRRHWTWSAIEQPVMLRSIANHVEVFPQPRLA